MAVNRDREAFVAAEGAADTGSGEPWAPGPPAPGAEPRGRAGVIGGAGEESDGRAVRAQARREQRRSTILVAATRVFRDKGYHSASVNDIIDAAQIARGTFYLYFTSKREIFAELTATFLGLIRGSVQKISLDPEAGEPLAQMRANFRRVMNTVLEHGDLATIMLRGDSGDAEARAQLDLFYRQVVDLIGQAVTVGHALGFARDCDVHIIAVAALAGLKEVLGRMLDARQLADAAVAAGVSIDGVSGVGELRDGDEVDEVDEVDEGDGGVGGADVAAGDGGADVAAGAGGDVNDGEEGGQDEAVDDVDRSSDPAAPTQRTRRQRAFGGRSPGVAGPAGAPSPWLMPSERLADELLTFFVRGVFTEDAR